MSVRGGNLNRAKTTFSLASACTASSWQQASPNNIAKTTKDMILMRGFMYNLQVGCAAAGKHETRQFSYNFWRFKLVKQKYSNINIDNMLIGNDRNRQRRLTALIRRNYVQGNNQLYLPSSDLEGEDIEFIINLNLQQLETLKISGNSIGLMGVKFLSMGKWSHLRRLELKSSKIGATGVRQLIKGDWKTVEHVRLGFNELGNEGMSYLSKAEWKNLSELWLQGNHIGKEGVRSLSKASWKKLTFLSLWDNKFEIQCAKQLTRMENSLQKLQITFAYCDTHGKKEKQIQAFIKEKYTTIDIRD